MVLYKITNNINNMIYVGKDEKNNPNYFGSGKRIIRAIKKYGIENFTKEILYYAKDSLDLIEKEKEIVNEDFVKRKDTYNIALGGYGGNTIIGFTESELNDYKIKISKACSGEKNGMFGKRQSEEGRQRISEANKREDHPNNNRENEANPFFNKSHSDEMKQKWSNARSGGGNPMAKSCIANGKEYPSTRDASYAIGIHPSTIRQRINSDKYPDYYYL